jgi:small subunit ribosomal protein S14
MAKLCMIEREKRRTQSVKKLAARRKALKALIISAKAGMEERLDAARKLNKLPRDSSPSRQHNRCKLTGRPHGYYRKFGLGRNKLREAAMRGDVPGLVKASW